jgi:hypothetical protein
MKRMLAIAAALVLVAPAQATLAGGRALTPDN